MSQSEQWKNLFREQDSTRLALLVRETGAFGPDKSVRALGDDKMLLLGGASHAARLSKRSSQREPLEPLCVVVTPEEEQQESEFLEAVKRVRAEFPEAELAGFGPKSCWPLLDRLVMKVGEVGKDFTLDSQWDSQNQVAQKLSAVLVYSPEASPEALEKACEALLRAKNLHGVVALPLGAGDRIPLPGLTTAGTVDMMILSALRLLLPQEIKVRASWAALGWKVAQLAVMYGANELAGWSAAETAVYSGRVRAAARVEEDELLQGMVEAGWRRTPWIPGKVGVEL